MTSTPYSRGLSRTLRDKIVGEARTVQERKETTAFVSSGIRPPSFAELGDYEQTLALQKAGNLLGIANPFFRLHQGHAKATTSIDNRICLNFASYDYLGLNADARTAQAACSAIEHYGVSASASRMVAGDRPVHRSLEASLAELYGVDDALTFVSGHATNVSLIGSLMSEGDLVLHDAYVHNSITVGVELSGAERRSFKHNDFDALEHLLKQKRRHHEKLLVVVEGLYSMDGDLCDLPRLIELRATYGFWLMVDEAHALGCIGATGRGSAEYFGVDPCDVDIWMGTLSKTLASTGGYVAGSSDLINYLKHHAPGFVYSVALPPALAASANCALGIMVSEPERAEKLRANCDYFFQLAESLGLQTDLTEGSPVMPIMVGNSALAAKLSERLLDVGINVAPVTFPGVPMNKARLRFFLTSTHTSDQIETAVRAVRSELDRLEDEGFVDLVAQLVSEKLEEISSGT